MADIVTIQTLAGEENLVRRYMDLLIEPGLATEIFIPRREMRRRFRGEWVTRVETLFPGYAFVESPDPSLLFLELKRIPRLSKVLADCEYSFYGLSPEEESFIRRIGAERGDHTFALSQVCIPQEEEYRKGDRVEVVSGDLLNYEGEIVDYDLHRRKAMVRCSLFGGSVIHVGVELLRKVGNDDH